MLFKMNVSNYIFVYSFDIIDRYLDQHMNDTACKHLNLSPRTNLTLTSGGVYQITVPFNNSGPEAFVITNWTDLFESNIKNITECPPDSCEIM